MSKNKSIINISEILKEHEDQKKLLNQLKDDEDFGFDATMLESNEEITKAIRGLQTQVRSNIHLNEAIVRQNEQLVRIVNKLGDILKFAIDRIDKLEKENSKEEENIE